MPVVPRVAETGTNGAVEPLDRQVLRSPLRRMPPQQSADHAEIADCIEPERRRDSHFGDNHAAQRRTDRATDIDADAVRCHRLIQVLLGNELRNDRLSSGGCLCAGHTGEKCEQNRVAGVARHNQKIAGKIADIKVYADSLTMRNLRTSRMSASAPAGIATRNIGSVVATCTSDTMNGSGLRLVISQPEAALNIQAPMLAMTVAVQMTANDGCRNGLKGEPTFVEA